jgi:t-SNARE complex subunit (syntaxin)
MRDDIGSSEQRIKSIMMRVRKNKLVLFGSLGVVALIILIAIIVHFATK